MEMAVHNLRKKFGELVVIENFSLAVAPGEMIGILGRSGSGKTTLINMLGLIEEKDAGEIFYNGNLITKMKEKRKLLQEHIGFIFQNYGLVENETVYDNLNLVRRIRKKSKQAKLSLMSNTLIEVGLSDTFLNRKIFTCSGGEQQRIAIAKILLKEASIIFADEPTASLDNANKQNILSNLKKLQACGKTIIMVSHDQDVCDECDRIVTL